MSHSPGPWHKTRNKNRRPGLYILDSRNRDVCRVLISTKGKPEEQMANASLIEMATDMLQILETLIKDSSPEENWLKAKEIVARAKANNP